MQELIVSELTQAAQEFIRGFARFLPRLIVLLVITLVGWLIARLVKLLARSILQFVKFDRLSENAGASQLLAKAALPASSDLVSRFIFWIVWLGFVLLGISILGIFGLQEQIALFFLFLPRLFVALFILFFGLLAASFFSRAVLLAAVNGDIGSPRLLSGGVRAAIIAFTISMVFEELGIAHQTMLMAFGIAFGAAMFGLAIAFGTGGKDLAREFLEKKFGRVQEEKHDDELSAL